MEFIVATSDFRHAMKTLAPFLSTYPDDAPREVLLKIDGAAGHLVAERSGHRIASPFPVSGAADACSVVMPFRIASGICDIDRNFGVNGNRPNAHMRIEDRDGAPVFAYEACGATCEVPVRAPGATKVPHIGSQNVLGQVEPAIFSRALGVVADVLDVRDLDESHRIISFVSGHDGRPSAIAATAHELVVVQGEGLVAGVRVHLSTVPLLASFLRRASGRTTVAACDTHVTITDSAGQSFAFPQPSGSNRHPAAPVTAIAASDVAVRIDMQPLVDALEFLACESRDYPARATLTPDGTLRLHVRESERQQSHIEVSTSFVTQACELSFRFKPVALLRLIRSYDTNTIELRLSTGGGAVRLLSATETTSDGTLKVLRVATLML